MSVEAPPVYLDHNATTPVHPAVRDAMLPWLTDRFGNPSSRHRYGAQAAEALAGAKASVAALIGGRPEEILFTSGGTESDNLAVLGTVVPRTRLVVSSVEHPAVEVAAQVRAAAGWSVDRLAVDRLGRVDLEVASALDEPAGLVSVMLAQNETGVVQPVREVVRRAKKADPDVVVHTDAAQAVGKIPVDVRALGVDLLTMVGHKFYTPAGIGALWIRDGIEVAPLLHGGGQGGGRRPGTEPMALIVGLAAACELARSDLDSQGRRQAALRDALWDRLRSGSDRVVRTAGDAATLPNTLHVCVRGRDGASVLARAPSLAASTGSACHADDETVSGVLGAMGVPAELAMGALRLSLGRSTTAEDVERAATALLAAIDSAPVVA